MQSVVITREIEESAGSRSAPIGTLPLDEKRLTAKDLTVLKKGVPVRRLSTDGRPKDELASERQDAANRTKTTVKHALKRGSQETERAMNEK